MGNTAARTITGLLLLLAGAICPSAALAQVEGEPIYEEYLAGPEWWFLFKDQPGELHCAGVDLRFSSSESVPMLGGGVVARALVPNARTYVYWVTNSSRNYSVYVAFMVIRGCVAEERQHSRRDFVGDNRFYEAMEYYRQLLMEQLGGAT
ncbi:MAG: hypothetical protein IT535_04380 [Bauldia sp.]|nr:hypothetical protein [Bauldia sp.]